MSPGTKMKVYLSGSITKKDGYKKDFEEAERILRDCGYDTINPATFGGTVPLEYHEYIKRDLQALLECDYICFVNDVTTSKGALIERIVAQETGVQEIALEDCENIRWLVEHGKKG